MAVWVFPDPFAGGALALGWGPVVRRCRKHGSPEPRLGCALKEVVVTATFGPAPGDWATLSKTSRGTIEGLYRHPITHNMEWSAVVALFEKLGTVDHKGHNELAFGLGGEHHRLHKPHSKDLTAQEVMAFRHMLTRAGWAPQTVSNAGVAPSGTPGTPMRDAPDLLPDLLVVVDHHEARLYHLDVRSAALVDHVIRPFDPHHLLHHVSHNDQAREQRQRTPEDHAFYETIAQAVAQAGAIVVIGHGAGRSNAAHHLIEFLHRHHPLLAGKVVCEVVADLSGLTEPQLLDLGRRALTAGTPSTLTERPTP